MDRCNILLKGTGLLNTWKWPDIPGIHDFKGPYMHSARWDHRFDWTDKRVALIGAVGSALLCYFGWRNVPRVGNLCLVMEDNFDTFDTQHTWQHEVDMGGFG